MLSLIFLGEAGGFDLKTPASPRSRLNTQEGAAAPTPLVSRRRMNHHPNTPTPLTAKQPNGTLGHRDRHRNHKATWPTSRNRPDQNRVTNDRRPALSEKGRQEPKPTLSHIAGEGPLRLAPAALDRAKLSGQLTNKFKWNRTHKTKPTQRALFTQWQGVGYLG